MGFFSEFKDWRVKNSLADNGLAHGTNSECCERCRYRMDDPRSSYLVCAQHRIHVGANQVCQAFSRGEPIYELR